MSLSSAYASLGNADWQYQGSAKNNLPTTGDATLAVNAGTIDLVGNSVLQGLGSTRLNAVGDIRLVGQVDADLNAAASATPPVIHATGSLAVAGTMSLTASQVYPTTLSEFALSASGNGSRIEFHRNGAEAITPLSAAGTVSVNAENILQNGVLRAPFGNITLTAQDNLTYGANSLTSVAGSGTVPFGQVRNGREWLYDFGNGNTVAINGSASNGLSLPEKAVVSNAKSVNVEQGSVIDLSGGGKLYAYETVPGPGGSRDVLTKASGTSAAKAFAVMPGYAGSVAPIDFQYQQDDALQVGDRIFLSGTSGLQSGFYTLLPAHYALLPGAFMVSAASGRRDMSPSNNFVQTDGTQVVAGYRGSAVASDSRWSGFLLRSGSQVRVLAEYADYSADTFFAGSPSALPQDGGRVAFATSDALSLAGLIRLGAAPAGRRGIADISAPEIQIVSDATQDTGKAVKLLAASLTGLEADSLLIGGVRDIKDGKSNITVGASNVTLANDAAHQLSGPEIILAAKNEVVLRSGSALSNSGSPDTSRGDLLVAGTGAEADGAVVRVSGGPQVAVVRNVPSGLKGTVTIEPNSTIAATGSMNIDATKSINNQSSLGLGKGAALSLGANRISFGEAVPETVEGLRFDGAALNALSSLSNLSFSSYTTFDVYGAANLGSDVTRTLSLRGAGIQSYGSSDTVLAIAAETVRFDGGGTFVPAAGKVLADGTVGTLTVAAKDIEVGGNNFDLRGYKDISMTAQREIRSAGTNGTVSAEKNMTLAAGQMTSASGKDASLKAGGKLKLTTVASPQPPLTTDAAGGKLTFIGSSIVSDANIIAKSGQIILQASGDTGGVRVDGGEINVSGYSKTFGSTVASASAGSIVLDGGRVGNVAVGPTAVLDVSATGAAAGSLSVKAIGGTAAVNGVLRGQGVNGGKGSDADPGQGRFSLDVNHVGDADQFAALNTRLNAGGYTESRTVRARDGDIALAAANDTIQARQVILSADNGDITLGGTVDASGAKGGRIELYAGQATAAGRAGNVTLLATGRLLANATATATNAAGSVGDGGSVVIGTSAGDGLTPGAVSGNRIDLRSGSEILVGGQGLGSGGSVTLRAPRTGAGGGNDVAIATLGTTITGSRSTTIEAYKVYTASRISSDANSATNLDVATTVGVPEGLMFTDASSFAGNASAISNRFGIAGSGYTLNPGMEVRSAGDLLVSVNETAAAAQNRGWNLNAWRFAGQPGVLTLRAAGNLTINGSISDGFVKPTTAIGMPGWSLDPAGGASWSYQLAGGADFSSANPLGVNPSNTVGDVTVGFARTTGGTNDQPVALIRTGTGRIDLAAGRDITLGAVNAGTANALGATLYTAGQRTELAADVGAPKRQTVNPAYATGTVNATAEFAQGGGAIHLAASRNITGTATSQLINNWLFRRGRTTTDSSGATVFSIAGLGVNAETQQTAWWSRYDYFNQGVATFGGGDITVSAEKGSITDLSVSVGTNGQIGGTDPAGVLVERGGGDFKVSAGGDIRGGAYYVQRGQGSLRAGGSVIASDRKVTTPTGAVALRPILALGDASIVVEADREVQIETAFNPTQTRQNSVNAPAVAQVNNFNTATQYSYFSTYGNGSGVALSALTGSVVLGNNPNALVAVSGNAIAAPLAADVSDYRTSDMFRIYPGNLSVASLFGDISYERGFTLAPAAQGQLNLLAGQSIKSAFGAGGGERVVMSDVDPARLPGVNSPRPLSVNSDIALLTYSGGTDGIQFHTPAVPGSDGLHSTDAEPVRIIALNGDITGDVRSAYTAILPKRAEISAGRDISNFGFKIQQLAPGDVTRIDAGRDFVDSTSSLGPISVRHLIGGPGRVDLVAGRNIDLGNGGGIVTRGNLDNSYLPEAGAGINLVAGAKADYENFFRKYVTSSDLSGSPVVAPENDPNGAAPPTGLEIFDALKPAEQAAFLDSRKPLLNRIFFSKLRAASTGPDGGVAKDLSQFDAIIASLYPVASLTGGDINVFGSQLKTERGGEIDLFAPGGSLFAGLQQQPIWLANLLRSNPGAASQFGVLTIRGGEVQGLVKTDFQVNQGRVFTLGGGDITLVSQYGDIDAGRGTKTAVSAPPPLITTDAKGNTVVDISGSIAGSGIATLSTGPDVPASNVYPVAPRGIFDAGDAGVRSTGSVSIVAQTVLNANNIAAAGSVSGAKADSSGLAAAASAPPSAPPATKTEAISNPPAPPADAAANLTVELLGIGAVDSQQSVIQDGQTSPSAKPSQKDDDEDRK